MHPNQRYQLIILMNLSQLFENLKKIISCQPQFYMKFFSPKIEFNFKLSSVVYKNFVQEASVFRISSLLTHKNLFWMFEKKSKNLQQSFMFSTFSKFLSCYFMDHFFGMAYINIFYQLILSFFHHHLICENLLQSKPKEKPNQQAD